MKRLLTLLSAFFIFSIAYSQTKNTTKILIETKFGNITAVLYDDTPLHRDNFIKLVNSGWYKNSIFHRVINNFMIQGGGKEDKINDPGYTIPAEFKANHFHKKGALAAARKGDHINPKKESSGSQFYIVKGQVFNEATLNSLEVKGGIKFSADRRATYTTLGGTPHLDDNYTVFGEVIDGLDVIDKISAVKTDSSDKPLEDVIMNIKIIK